ncbi:MAG: hypothetical protein KGL59_11925, partial [Acidobacteriota bacterium]|nr:hypothetical protein [Acidobacteriota bacterium]
MFAQFTARARGDARWLRRSGILLAFAALLVVPNCKAQLPQAGDTTSPPTPGVGHDYIHAPEETVNPANGSVSIRIPVRVPQGRELTLPLYIAYDSNGAFYYGQSPGNQQPHYATTTNVPFSLGGWSYTFPMLTYQLVTWTQQYKSGKNYTCTGSMNYVFQDPTGNRHSLPLTVAATSGPGGADCGGNNATQGSEGPILAISGLPSWGWGTYPTATVTNGNGTVYSFPGGLETLPTSVTDRNGNTISISSTSSSATLTDTVGRTAVSVPTFGASTDNISVAGLGAPYAVSWTSASANFTIGTVNLNPSTYQDCPTSMSASASVVSQVALPNGQKYTFSYDPTYGMLKQITYPSGGSVRYQWGLNTQSEAGGWTASTGSEWYCSYDFPAVTDRWVNDGTKDILHQQFSYSTTWNGSTGQWTTKKTIVTTYDLIRNTSFQTIYTYTPVPSPSVPNPTGGAEGCGITCAIPVEASIEYYGTDGKLLKTVAKTWCNNDPRELCSVQTTLDNGDT